MTRMEKIVERVKDEILGKQYELSFSFVSKNKIRELNRGYRRIDQPTDILSFPLSDKTASAKGFGAPMGEILICKEIAKHKFETIWNRSLDGHHRGDFNDFLLFLIIHGCLHLSGLDHSPRMSSLEQKYFKKFK